MFRNLLGWLRSRKTPSQRSFRPRLEVLEDRTVPDAVPPIAALNALEVLSSNPALANANAVLNNQLADQLLILPSFNQASAGQLLSTIQSNPSLLGSLATVPNFVGNTFALLGQQTALTADLAELLIDPSVAANPQFDQSINNLANGIHENLLFSNPVAYITTFLGGESMLNGVSGDFTSSGLVNNASTVSGFPYDFTFNPATLNFTASPVATAPSSFTLGLGNQTLNYPALAGSLTPFALDTSAYGPFAGMPGSATGQGGMLGLTGFGSFPLPFDPTLDQGFGFDGTINPTSGMT